MKRMTYFVMALALVLGLAQCKKEQPETPQNEGNSVMITLDVKGDNNAKVDVDPPHVTFKKDDEIVVACNGHYVGTLTHNGTNFSGSVTNATPGQPLYFYFFGNVSPQFFGENRYNCTVYIGDQTKELPVISMGPSINSKGEIVNYQDGTTSYTARLHNKCSLMKFNVTANTEAPICINGMNNFVNVKFDRSGEDGFIDGFKYSQVYNGEIKMKGQVGSGTKTYWAIVLPQANVKEGGAYTEDYTNIGERPAIEGGIGINEYYSAGVAIYMESYDPLATPLTFEAISDITVTLNKAGSNYMATPYVSLFTSTDDGEHWTSYTVGTPIELGEGETVMFRGTNDKFGKNLDSYNNFSINGECYVYGNIMSLINAENYASTTSLGHSENNQYTFACLFEGCKKLYDHPQKPLELPATGLANYCYSHMFSGCTGLTVAPKLPARDLTTGCYQGMFNGCTGLEESPVLPAATLVSECYASMFSSCTSLGRVTCLATSGMGDNTSGWLSNVPGGGTFTKAAGVTWPTGPNGIPDGWAIEQ